MLPNHSPWYLNCRFDRENVCKRAGITRNTFIFLALALRLWLLLWGVFCIPLVCWRWRKIMSGSHLRNVFKGKENLISIRVCCNGNYRDSKFCYFGLICICLICTDDPGNSSDWSPAPNSWLSIFFFGWSMALLCGPNLASDSRL